MLCITAWALSAGFAAADSLGDDPHSGPAMNYHEIDSRLATGGHFVDGGLEAIRKKGVEVVIDLRDKPPKGQKERLAEIGIEWISVPVVWKDPRPIDFERFSAAMSANKDKNVLVQCQANYRASAFTYLYRVKQQGLPDEVAANDLNAIWEPDGRWRKYMDAVLNANQVK
ncbi:MAG: protein tyrosine phosphatase family protein [Woeseiaceae bacterium]